MYVCMLTLYICILSNGLIRIYMDGPNVVYMYVAAVRYQYIYICTNCIHFLLTLILILSKTPTVILW